MTSPLDGGLVGFQTSQKDIDFGWARGDQEQFYERLFRNLRQVDAALANQWAFNPRQTIDLKYAFFGGIIDSGSGWTVIPNGTVDLVDDAVNYIERDANGVVTVNQAGFTYPTHIPMAEVTARNNQVAEYLDRRPELGGATGGGGVGCTDFPCLAGQILPSQVPLAAVAQYLTRGNLPAAIAYEDEENTFTERQEISGTAPTLTLIESDVTDNNLDITLNGTVLQFWRVNDARTTFVLQLALDISSGDLILQNGDISGVANLTVLNTIFANNIVERTAGAGVTVDGELISDLFPRLSLARI